jgi:2,4-dienoyl-CoA reductase-like NADH-dependent reductase (Old Yellow Enzyme family)
MPGMQRALCVDGRLLPEMADYYRRRVEGGVGLVIGEGCAVDHPSSIWESRFPRLNQATLDGWAACVEAVHAAGGSMLVQLSHPGAFRSDKQSLPEMPGPALSASGLYGVDKQQGRAATQQELAEIRDAFVRAARYVEQIGADGVELHGCHGFFLDEFLWSETNRRDDRYGGPTIAERVRYPAEVVAAIRRAVSDDFIVSFRFSQWKEVDYGARIVASPDELGELLAILRSAGVDVFHPSTRRFDQPEWPGSELGLAGWTKRLTDAPVIAVGSVGLSNDVMESLLGSAEPSLASAPLKGLARRFRNGEFDMIAVGRSLLADADWVRKVAEGRLQDVRVFRKHDMGEALEMEPTLIIEAHKDDAPSHA